MDAVGTEKVALDPARSVKRAVARLLIFRPLNEGITMPKRRARPPRTGGQEIIGLFGGFLIGYIAAEGLLAHYLHPLHWLVAGVVAILGYFAGLVWNQWRHPQR